MKALFKTIAFFIVVGLAVIGSNKLADYISSPPMTTLKAICAIVVMSIMLVALGWYLKSVYTMFAEQEKDDPNIIKGSDIIDSFKK